MSRQSNQLPRPFLIVLLACFLSIGTISTLAYASTSSDQLQITATVPVPPPQTPAILTYPRTNSTFISTPIVARGTCGQGLTVRIFDNGELAGSTTCQQNGSFITNITLFIGKNVLKVLNFDSLDQAGPESSQVVVYVNPPEEQPLPSPKTTSEQPKPDDSVRIFAGTPLDPVAKLLRSDATVSPGTHFAITILVNAVFVLILAAITRLITV